jgi:hypothetical protein
VPIHWAFAKVRRGDVILFDVVARELMRQMNAGVVGVAEGGGELLGGPWQQDGAIWSAILLKIVPKRKMF